MNLIEKLTEAGYIGFIFAGQEKLTVPNFIWDCLWFLAFVVGAIFIIVAMANDEYSNKKFFANIVSVFLIAWVWESFAFYFSFGYGAVFKALGIFLGSACLIKILIRLHNRYDSINKPVGNHMKVAVVDLKTIKNLYQVSKGRFDLPRYYDYNLSYDRCFFKIDPEEDWMRAKNVQFTFPNFFEYLKFYAWDYMENRAYSKHKDAKQRAKDNEKSKEALKLVIEQAQADIDVLKARAEDEIEQANEMMAEIGKKKA